MSTKHTPGPWNVKRVKDVLMPQTDYLIQVNGATIAELYVAHDVFPHEANARLIAAAPGNADPDQSSIGSTDLWGQAKAFLQKARGES